MDFPYTASDSTPCVEENQQGYRVTDYHTVSATTAEFKASLYNDGPSYWRYMVHTDFYTFWNSYAPGTVYVNNAYSYESGHAVLLIGWDDAIPAKKGLNVRTVHHPIVVGTGFAAAVKRAPIVLRIVGMRRFRKSAMTV